MQRLAGMFKHAGDGGSGKSVAVPLSTIGSVILLIVLRVGLNAWNQQAARKARLEKSLSKYDARVGQPGVATRGHNARQLKIPGGRNRFPTSNARPPSARSASPRPVRQATPPASLPAAPPPAPPDPEIVEAQLGDEVSLFGGYTIRRPKPLTEAVVVQGGTDERWWVHHRWETPSAEVWLSVTINGGWKFARRGRPAVEQLDFVKSRLVEAFARVDRGYKMKLLNRGRQELGVMQYARVFAEGSIRGERARALLVLGYHDDRLIEIATSESQSRPGDHQTYRMCQEALNTFDPSAAAARLARPTADAYPMESLAADEDATQAPTRGVAVDDQGEPAESPRSRDGGRARARVAKRSLPSRDRTASRDVRRAMDAAISRKMDEFRERSASDARRRAARRSTAKRGSPQPSQADPARRTDTRERVAGVVLSDDGTYAAFGTSKGAVQLFNPATRALGWKFDAHPNVSVYTLAISADGTLVATAGRRGKELVLWNVPSRSRVAVLDESETTSLLAFSPNGKYLATATGGGRVVLWDVETGEPWKSLDKQPNVQQLCWSDNSRLLAFRSRDGWVRVWHAKAERLLVDQPAGRSASSIALSPSGRRLLTLGVPRPTLTNVATGEITRLRLGGLHGTQHVAFLGDEKRIVALDRRDRLVVFDVDSQQEIAEQRLETRPHRIIFTRDGRHALWVDRIARAVDDLRLVDSPDTSQENATPEGG